MDERVLLVEDDASTREVAAMVLERAGYKVTTEADGVGAVSRFSREPFDLVVLDLMLPRLDGFGVCREIRRTSTVPLVMLTARDETSDVVAGLELGADDYVTKPFEGPELVARVRAVLRRASSRPEDRTLAFGELEIDPAAFQARKAGEALALSATEFRLLHELANRRGHVLSRQTLLERVWSYMYLGDSRLVDMAVKRLRDKIEDDPGEPRYIVTVRGVGYRFDG